MRNLQHAYLSVPQLQAGQLDNLNIEFSNNYLETLSNLAFSSKLGARALKGLVENSVFNLMYRVKSLNERNIKSIRFDDYPLTNDKYPVLIDKNGNETIDTEYKLYRGINE